MVIMDINNFIVSIAALVPTIVLAIFVERHYTSFWFAVWNAVALITAGLAAWLIPITFFPLQIQIQSYFVPLWIILVAYGSIILVIGFKIHENTLREFASSKLTAAILLMSIVAHQFWLTNGLVLLGLVVGFWVLFTLLMFHFRP